MGQGHVDSHSDEVLPHLCEKVDPTFGCVLRLTDVLEFAILRAGRVLVSNNEREFGRVANLSVENWSS
jgi:hypothetical protein